MTQVELGAHMGVPANVISRWERGEVSIGVDRLVALIGGCGLQCDIALRPADDSNRSLTGGYRGLTPVERLAALQRRVDTVARVQGRDERFDPEAVLRALEPPLAFIVIGGVAAALHGGPHPTYNLDLVVRPSPRNVSRVKDVLRRLGADAPETEAGIERWSTRHGEVQLIESPAGTGGFKDLVRDAEMMDLGGMRVNVASLADVVRSKDAVGRPDERAAVNALRELVAV